MEQFHGPWIELGIELALATACAAPLSLVAARLWDKPKKARDGWRFPVKSSCLMAHWIAFTGGVGLVAFASRRLLTLAASDRLGWTGFGCGVAIVLLVLSAWPQPIVFDREGVLIRGSMQSRICWKNLSHIRQYRLRSEHGIVLHSVYGRQLAIDSEKHDTEKLLSILLERRAVPLLAPGGEFGPISIAAAPEMFPPATVWDSGEVPAAMAARPFPQGGVAKSEPGAGAFSIPPKSKAR